MNTKSNEAGQPEQQPNSEQAADNISVSPAIGNTNVIGSFQLDELRKLFHECWTNNANGIYLKSNWKDFRTFLQKNLNCEI